jgi:hypothetical protein
MELDLLNALGSRLLLGSKLFGTLADPVVSLVDIIVENLLRLVSLSGNPASIFSPKANREKRYNLQAYRLKKRDTPSGPNCLQYWRSSA